MERCVGMVLSRQPEAEAVVFFMTEPSQERGASVRLFGIAEYLASLLLL